MRLLPDVNQVAFAYPLALAAFVHYVARSALHGAAPKHLRLL